MAVSYNPSVSTGDLMVCVDAGNTKSYPGSGTVWTNIANATAANSATLVSAPVYSSNNGGFFTFNGSTQYATFGDILDTVFVGTSAMFTVSAWVKLAVTNMLNSYIVGKWATGEGQWVLRIGDGSTPDRANFFWSNPGNTAYINQNSSITITDTNKWYNIVGVYDIMSGPTTSMKIYVDGVDVSTYNENNVGSPTQISTTSADLIIGNRLDLTRGFNGSISNIMIHDRALSPLEVKQNFNAMRGRYGL